MDKADAYQSILGENGCAAVSGDPGKAVEKRLEENESLIKLAVEDDGDGLGTEKELDSNTVTPLNDAKSLKIKEEDVHEAVHEINKKGDAVSRSQKNGALEKKHEKVPKTVSKSFSTLAEWKETAKKTIDPNLYYCRDCRVWSILKDEDICPSCLIPVYTSVKSDVSSLRIEDKELCDGIQSKLFSPSEIPFGLKKLNRLPQEILCQRAKMLKKPGGQVNHKHREHEGPQIYENSKYLPPDLDLTNAKVYAERRGASNYSLQSRPKKMFVSSLTELDNFCKEESESRKSLIQTKDVGCKMSQQDYENQDPNVNHRIKTWITKKIQVLEKIDLLKKRLLAVTLVHGKKSFDEITSLQIPIFTSLKKIEDEMSNLNGMKTNIALFVFDAVERDTSNLQENKPRKTHSLLELEIEQLKKEVEELKLSIDVKDFASHIKNQSEVRLPNKCSTSPYTTASANSSKKCFNQRKKEITGIPSGTLPCMKFNNLYDIGGQVGNICRGSNGSKFVIRRLRDGAYAERRYAFVELRLPKQLVEVIGSEGGRRVVATLMEVDTPSRVEILRHIKNSLSQLIVLRNFRDFFHHFLDLYKPAKNKDHHLQIQKILCDCPPLISEKMVRDIDGFLDELISKRRPC